MMLDKTLDKKRRNGREITKQDAILLDAIMAKGGSFAPSVRAAQGRRQPDRRSPAQRRRDRRQRLAILRESGSKRA